MMDLKKSKIAVLMGGWNEESEVSMQSGQAVFSCLTENDFTNCHQVIVDNNLIQNLQDLNPDIAFNALHGKFGEDGNLQSILNFLNIPYTHSGVLASAIGMDKLRTAIMLSSFNIVQSPRFAVLKKGSSENPYLIDKIGYPFVIKPINSGSSVGVEIFLEEGGFDIDDYDWKYGSEVMIEEYIKGKEVQVGVINNRAVGAIEVRPKNLFYDYECKYVDGMTDYVMPAEVSNQVYDKLLSISEQIHLAFNCNNISRIDFIVKEESNEIYFLEVNTHPGLTSHSLVPKIGSYYNISFFEIIESLLISSKCDI